MSERNEAMARRIASAKRAIWKLAEAEKIGLLERGFTAQLLRDFASTIESDQMFLKPEGER